MPVLHKYAKTMKETDERSGVLYLRFNKVSGSSDRVCSIMDVPPAVDPDPTPQTSAPVFHSHSLLKRAPTCLLSGSEARSLLCPFFQVKLRILSLSVQALGVGSLTCSSDLALVFACGVLFEGLLDFFLSPECSVLFGRFVFFCV